MGGRTCSTWVVTREGAAAKSIPYCYLLASMLLRQLPNNKSPQESALAIYIAGDTLCHQPIGNGHMTSPFLVHPMQFWVTQVVGQWRQAQGGLAGVSSTRPYLVCSICGFRPAQRATKGMNRPSGSGKRQASRQVAGPHRLVFAAPLAAWKPTPLPKRYQFHWY